jgi:hypothetical protein
MSTTATSSGRTWPTATLPASCRVPARTVWAGHGPTQHVIIRLKKEKSNRAADSQSAGGSPQARMAALPWWVRRGDLHAELSLHMAFAAYLRGRQSDLSVPVRGRGPVSVRAARRPGISVRATRALRGYLSVQSVLAGLNCSRLARSCPWIPAPALSAICP